jgi:hypothetical protein
MNTLRVAAAALALASSVALAQTNVFKTQGGDNFCVVLGEGGTNRIIVSCNGRTERLTASNVEDALKVYTRTVGDIVKEGLKPSPGSCVVNSGNDFPFTCVLAR